MALISVFPDEQTLARALAARLIDDIIRDPEIVLGLPTGRTPLALYAELAARAGDADWSRVRTFNLDEFVGLGGDMPGSYRAFMDEALFRHVNLAVSHIGFLDGRAADLDAECARYEHAIASAGGIDVLLLGIGANGHIGFNEPGTELKPRTHRATLALATRAANAALFGDEVARVPAEALSMGLATILQARAILLVATGEEKSAVVSRALDCPITTELPASFLQLHPRVSVWLDAEAASRR